MVYNDYITNRTGTSKNVSDDSYGKEEKVVEISEIRVRMVNNESKMKAVISVTFDEVFVVHDIKVIEGDKGVFVAMPSRRSPDGVYRDIVHPISTEFRTLLVKLIIDRYEQEKESQAIAQSGLQEDTL